MEYLVTMATHVPDGTSEDAVQDIRTREAAHSRELATQRHLLRLWRPPLKPGEWRSLGLFSADDSTQLEGVLASMPLKVWRTDEVTPLSPHPNDPTHRSEGSGSSAQVGGTEFLTTITVLVPTDTAPETVDADTASQADRARELAQQGHLERLCVLPGQGRALGLWRAADEGTMNAILESLPLYEWMSVETTPLTQHPSDPALTSG